METSIFDDVETRIDNNEIIAQQHAEDLFELYLKIQNAEKDSVIDIRKEASADHEEMLCELRNDLSQVMKMGMVNLSMQIIAQERNNRRKVNQHIINIKSKTEEIDKFFQRAISVLGAPPGYPAKKEEKAKTKNYLIQFGEVLLSISTMVTNLEQSLACYELKEVLMNGMISQIRTQISDFNKVIPNFKRILNSENQEIDPDNYEKFVDMKKRLFAMVNCLHLISEKRGEMNRLIEEKMNLSMPQFQNLQISNGT
ncbi:Protein containing ALS2cr12 (ALS2CR12) signature [Caenorhabditis elegans]|uniref:Protein containing ALS2cr12 (ALS2CR12) signature n=1 Tax=Caenorhabditis elegans TaxID=6239 RepID=Q22883_CAEEL|nr:Protein containing ALS2cr12 (ALS2CR12) signature [Caenorhabditis elegans]CCD62074.1 Protein containing ALS2cr12 (ALS2CR12) signature [Caenorhabditis elegans]|eukprot:NP_505259.1 Uncharacterized protein CELE_B0507.9 [Caenorhabditis elegans]